MEKKFRAWDKKNKRMLFFNGIFNDTPFVEKSTFPQYESCKEYCELSGLMQYTGLKDKNGKEVYEGDIVKDGAGQTNEIVYRVGGYWFNWLHLVDAVGPLEVIGNIYENPELLNGG